MNHSIKATALLSTIIAAASTTATAAPFTYQGSLQDSGAPANGEYDLRFELYNAAIGGSQIGPTINFNNVQVTDGTFQVDVDFGNTFNDSQAFIFIEVRDGASAGGYTGLLPRSPITATPKAQHATTATSAASLTNPQWEEAFDSVLTNTPSNDTVLINRTNRITGNEFFGVYGDIADFVGMYTAGPANSRPFYGYAVNGEATAFSFFESADDTWRLQLGFEQPIIADGADIIAGNKVIANNFEYKSPKTGYVSVMGDSFHSASEDPFIASAGTGGAYIANAGLGWLVAPVQLPHNATITSVRFYFTDNSAGSDFNIDLARRTNGSPNFAFLAGIDTTGASGSNLLREDSSVVFPTVDNNLYSYQLRAFSTSWSGNATTSVQAAVIEYTTTQVD